MQRAEECHLQLIHCCVYNEKIILTERGHTSDFRVFSHTSCCTLLVCLDIHVIELNIIMLGNNWFTSVFVKWQTFCKNCLERHLMENFFHIMVNSTYVSIMSPTRIRVVFLCSSLIRCIFWYHIIVHDFINALTNTPRAMSQLPNVV